MIDENARGDQEGVDGQEPGLSDCIHFITHSEDDVKLMRSDYGKTWRCWTRRPTDEERRAAAWIS